MDILAEAREAGVLPDYYDARGHHQHVPLEALKRVLDALPKPCSDSSAQPIVHRLGSGPIHVAASKRDSTTRWVLLDGARCVSEGYLADDAVRLPDSLAIGAYRLDLLDEDRSIHSSRQVLVVPPAAFQGDFDRVWVLAVQLYALRSDRNWGIGDFTDLKHLISIASELGCAGIGLNPLHALFDDQPASCSPYAPNSRLFLNPIYIDVEAVTASSSLDADLREAIAREKQQPLIDYPAVSRWKLQALRHAFEAFKVKLMPDDAAQFARFRQERGILLQRFACFETLRKQFQRPWWEWPEEFRKPTDDCLRKFEAQSGSDTEFVMYLQWIAHTQLQACTDFAKLKGLKVGLYLDVAVGVRADGFDAWLEQEAISRELSVGAPPDLLNVAGQDWGLSGFNGIGLTARGFEPFRAMIEASARYAGAIRLDHVMGLARLFLVPSGFSPREGAYVTMPLEALLGATALESQLWRCIVIGEDLGTVPEGFRDRLKEWGVWSYQVMLFEREYDGRFKSPGQFSSSALVTFNTHDLPSYAGWRSGHDLRVKTSIGIDPGESAEERSHAISALDRTLAENGIQDSDFAAVIKFLSWTPSRILAVSLDDIVGLIEQINVPGTVDEHPNWRRRLPISLEDLSARYRAVNMKAALESRL
ncbi:4-alpha-glucanotransferase [Bradyrhizobium sp. LHD-71]|uniref:4-alpha-glucanotransferase n=1 Tax=Bradyrhizobium sp. LHD-71 TaxID=3072141 RepID=UPI00280FC0B9|nr:4-alpha-glucanotransferase [Bradyrhizobium sp. LHD-71]MDQ8727706.1 4-alpha-glucanotransferase [Bradyrhizobium sp. LHD-71]